MGIKAMEAVLKNGKSVIIRRPEPEDAEALVRVLTQAAGETRFLAREPEEFSVTAEQQRAAIERVNADPDMAWFAAEVDGRVIGQGSVTRVRRMSRYRHRAELAFIVLQEYWGMGIGGRLMQACIEWAKENGVTQLELETVQSNERARRIYESFGFRITGTIPKALRYADGTYADEYRMVLEL